MAKGAVTGKSASSLVWLWLALVVVILDLASKQLAVSYLSYGDPNSLLPVLDITLLYNQGAAFSFLADAGGWQRWLFVLIAVVVSLVLLLWMKRTPKDLWWLGMALALILGGALGNLYDRVVQGYVIDFISVHYQHHYFPAFNLADSAITLGAAILIFDTLFLERRRTAVERDSQ